MPPSEVSLPFNCSICSSPITDRSALVSDCGHFFCLSPPASCTSLRQQAPHGSCEVCGKECNAVVSIQEAVELDPLFQTFVFGNPIEEIKTALSALNFREAQRQLMIDNAVKYKEQVEHLRSAYASLEQKLDEVKYEKEQLKAEVEMLRSSHSTDVYPSVTPAPQEEHTCTSITTMPQDGGGSRMQMPTYIAGLRSAPQAGDAVLTAGRFRGASTFPASSGMSGARVNWTRSAGANASRPHRYSHPSRVLGSDENDEAARSSRFATQRRVHRFGGSEYGSGKNGKVRGRKLPPDGRWRR